MSDDNETFANKMIYKRTGQCPVCNKLIRRGQGREGRGKFEIKHIPPNTPMYNLMLEPEPRAFSGLDDFVESTVEVVPVALERLVARYGDGDSGIEMVFFIGAATKRNGEPLILVGEPTISMQGEASALAIARDRIEVLEREIAKLHAAELARIGR